MIRAYLSALLAAALVTLAEPGHAQLLAPDYILLNGKVLTLDERNSVAEAIAIKAARILSVGSSKEIKALAGKETRVIDLGGRTVIPGLIDSHTHAIRGGLTYEVEVIWMEEPSLASAMQRIREAARRLPKGSWITVVGGWHQSQFPENRLPTPQELAAAAPEHPVYVQHLYDTVVLNPMAVQRLNIRDDKDVPPSGKVVKDATGQPTGIIHGNVPTFARLYEGLPKPGLEGEISGTKSLFRELNRMGMTAIVDASGGGHFPKDYRALFEIWKRKELSLRVAFRVMSQRSGKELDDLKTYSQFLPQGFGNEMLKFIGFGEVIVWGMHDGARAGQVFTPPAKAKEDFYQTAKWIAENGYTAEVHASSDSSARQLLDILERVNREAPISNLRWVIAHLDDGTDETLRRMKALGIAYAVQDRLYFSGDDVQALIGKERARKAPPLKSALDMRVTVAGGTDAPRITPYSPFIFLRWALDGKSVSGTQIRGAEEIPGRLDALKMYTLNSAWMSFDENERGSLERGKLADLAVLSKDYLTMAVPEVANIESLLTMVGGKVVYAGGPFKGLEK